MPPDPQRPAASLKISGAVKSFGETTVLDGIDLEVAAGEFVVFVGPSGSGKSTLLRLISGLDGLTKGSISIDATDVTRAHPSKRGVAMVFQSYALYPHMTVAGNMGFALRKAGEGKAEVAEKINRAAEILGIEALMERRPAELSGGQRQRVSIGRAIVRNPRIFLFDEPLSNLDSELRVQMRLEIARLHRELGTTMIFVTHDQVEAMTLADRIVILRDGRIEQVGKPLELYDNPVNAFVAGFLGSPRMNFLTAKVVGTSASGVTIELVDFDGVTITLPLAKKLDVGQECTLGIRPEHLRVDGAIGLQVRVNVIEMLGGTAVAYAASASGAPVTFALGTDRTVANGDRLQRYFQPEEALLFDTAGQRLR